jgi:hypothetical protein
VTFSQRFRVSRLIDPLGGVLTDRLEHPVALIASTQEALLDECGECADCSAADALSCLEGAAAREDSQSAKHVLLTRVEQAVAPVNRGAQGALTLGEVAWSVNEERQPLLETGKQLLR